jgi:hypothetical protein
MLPCLDRLSLHPAASTGEFYALSDPEAAELNANGGKDPLTIDKYPTNRSRGEDGATFRLFWDQSSGLNNPPGHRTDEEEAAAAADGGARKYAVYDAQMLWDWHKTRPRDPYNSFVISREDWMALYEDYGQNGPIPDFVATLPSYQWPDFGPGTRWVRQAAGVHNDKWTWVAYNADGAMRFKSKWRPTDEPPTNGMYFFGPRGEEHKVRLEMRDRQTNQRVIKHFSGERGREYVWKEVVPSAGTTSYYGQDGRVTRLNLDGGEVHYFAYYPHAKESLIYKSEWPNGTILERAKPDRLRPRALNAKRKVSFADGQVQEFVGAKNQERLVKLTFATGNFIEYEGIKGQEYRVKYTRTDGEIAEFEGVRGEERLVKVTRPDGTVTEYEGPKGQERVKR